MNNTRNHERNKEQGQNSVLHYEKNVSVRFYIHKELFVLNSMRTSLSIPTTGIKHSMSLSNKLILHSEG